MQHFESAVEEEVKKEFQLERLVLFSDAVFAIVITLMAIDIKIPDTVGIKLTSEELSQHLLHLLPVFIAYAFSFSFIGSAWYKHLQIFGFLKTYDGGLIFCNLLLLFSIGLFPFGASLVVHFVKSYLNFIIYIVILALCLISLLNLRYYVFIKHPELRNSRPIDAELFDYKIQRNEIISLGICFVLIIITNQLITDPKNKNLALLWFLPMAVVILSINKKYKKAKRQILKTS